MKSLAAHIDHTLLRPDATAEEIDALADEALRHGFAAVCVNGCWVERVARRLEGSPVAVAAVVGFPLGATLPAAKAREAALLVEAGATELDVVVQIGALRSGDHAFVEEDLRGVVAAGVPVKAILETGFLTRDETIAGCRIAARSGALFVKTSTGFGPRGASVDDVRLLRSASPPGVRVKAAGGIADARSAREMLAAGADRVGASRSVAIVSGEGG